MMLPYVIYVLDSNQLDSSSSWGQNGRSVEARIAVLGFLLFRTFRNVFWKKGDHQIYGTYIEPCS